MVKNRGSIDILADVIKASTQGLSKTRIMFKANLSYKLLTKYLAIAVNNGFISSDKSIYRVTPNGKAFLVDYIRYCGKLSIMQGLQEELDTERLYLEQIYLKSNLEYKNLQQSYSPFDIK